MMDLLQIICLGLIQGITEFLPISSSAHLVLMSLLFEWQDQGLFMDVVAHAGSLVAVLIYFRQEMKAMLWAMTHPNHAQAKSSLHLFKLIVIATLPIVVTGMIWAGAIEQHFRNSQVIAFATISFALLLLIADKSAKCQLDEYQLNFKQAILIGCAQVLALIPGASRAGVTMTAALLVGCNKVAAARFSFLLSIPTILAAVTYKLIKTPLQGLEIDWFASAVLFLISGCVAYLCIKLFVRLVNLVGMLPFVVYRLGLGVVLFIFV